MALLDRMKDAVRTTNSIDMVQQQAPQRGPADLHSANPAPAPAASQQPGKRPAAGTAAPAYTTEPDAIARAYYVEDRGRERRYFEDYQRKNLAIRSDDQSISSKREDLNTIRAMLTMAESRGWSEVKVNGTADFRREAWIEAQARGLTVQGYKASDLDRQEADRRRAERGQDPAHAVSRPAVNEVRQAAGTSPQAAPGIGQPIRAAAPPTQQRGGEIPQQPKQAAPYELSARNLGVVASPTIEPRREPSRVETATQQTPAPAPQPTRAMPVQAVEPGRTVQPRQTVPVQAVPATAPDHRKVLKEATAELSADGKLFLSALSDKIDREMNKLNADAKLEQKAFAATELVKKERAEGPVTLSPEMRKLATAPEPAHEQKAAPEQAPAPERERRQTAPEPPRRTRSR